MLLTEKDRSLIDPEGDSRISRELSKGIYRMISALVSRIGAHEKFQPKLNVGVGREGGVGGMVIWRSALITRLGGALIEFFFHWTENLLI